MKTLADDVLEGASVRIIKAIHAWSLARWNMDQALAAYVSHIGTVSPGSEESYFHQLVYGILEDNLPNVFYDPATNRIKVDGKEVVVKVHSHGKNRSDQGSSRAVEANDGEALHVHFFCQAYRPDTWGIRDGSPYQNWQVVTRWINMDDFCAGQHRGGNHTIESHTNHRNTTKWILGIPPSAKAGKRHTFYNVFSQENET